MVLFMDAMMREIPPAKVLTLREEQAVTFVFDSDSSEEVTFFLDFLEGITSVELKVAMLFLGLYRLQLQDFVSFY